MSKSAARVGYIDGLRAVAILIVVLRHYYMAVYRPDLPRWFDLLGYGYLGVHLFLLLSGLCIGWAYVEPNQRPFVAGEFLSRRMLRILPPYYVALGLSLVLTPPQGALDWVKQVLTHLTMTHNLFEDTVLALNGAFWSLALESQLYLLFPVVLAIARRRGWAFSLATVLAVQSAYRVSLLPGGTGYTPTTFVLPWGVLGRIFEFSLGVFLASTIRLERHRLSQPYLLAGVSILAGLSVLAKKIWGVTHPVTDLLWTLTFACVVWGAAQPGSLLRRVLEFQVLVRIGEASYSIYLVHNFVLGPLVEAVIDESSSVQLRVGGSIPLVVATLLVCYPFYQLVERPLIRLGRSRLEK
jgi:peptidoglycan/LPS O-acetylase OafA/YrhL